MKFNLGDKVKIRSNGVVGIIISRGYNEYLNENDKQQSFEEYQIEADKYYQCNEDEIELVTIGQVLQSIYDIPPQIKIKEIRSINEDSEKKLKNVKVINSGRVELGLNEEGDMIKERKCCGNCCEFDKSTAICEYNNIAVCRDSGVCEGYYPTVQEIEVKGNENNNDPVNPFMKEYKKIVIDTMELCEKKNKDYGNATDKSFKQFGDVSYQVRCFDKWNRINTLLKNGKAEVSESLEDSILDLSNYLFLWVTSRRLKNEGDK